MKKIKLSALLILTAGIGGCQVLKDAMTANVDVVARAGSFKMDVDRLAEIIAKGKSLPLRLDVVERVASLWVDYAIFAQRIVGGDSLLDTATVKAAMWAEIQQRIANHYHDQYVQSQSEIDSSVVDSAYTAGEYMIVSHILFKTDSTMSASEKARKRRKAEQVRRQLMNGMSWKKANEQNEGPSKVQDGNLGLHRREDFVSSFAAAAFRLKPGEISSVTESPFGYHVIRRPPLSEVWDQFKAELTDKFVTRADTAFLRELEKRRHIEVEPDAAGLVREAAFDPLRGRESRKVIGTYDGGEFTVGDFVKWLQGFPSEIQRQVPTAGDEQIMNFVHTLVRNNALLLEAEEAGITVTPEDFAALKDRLKRSNAILASIMGVSADSLVGVGGSPEELKRVAAVKVDNYLEAIATDQKRFIAMNPFLADYLRDQSSWRIVAAGLERTLEKAKRIRSTFSPVPPGDGTTSGTTVPPAADSSGGTGSK